MSPFKRQAPPIPANSFPLLFWSLCRQCLSTFLSVSLPRSLPLFSSLLLFIPPPLPAFPIPFLSIKLLHVSKVCTARARPSLTCHLSLNGCGAWHNPSANVYLAPFHNDRKKKKKILGLLAASKRKRQKMNKRKKSHLSELELQKADQFNRSHDSSVVTLLEAFWEGKVRYLIKGQSFLLSL